MSAVLEQVQNKQKVHARKPDFFIVGAPKSGTTAMSEYLGRHPHLFMAKKEMHFFGSDLKFGPQFYKRGEKEYLAEFDGWSEQRHGGEASVWYLFSREAAAEIKAFNPEARIIIMLREPSAMLYSLYHQFLADGNEQLPSFEEALAAESQRREGRRLARTTYLSQGLVYRECARYTEQVNRYLQAFGRERVHVIIYDDFATDPADAYARVTRFLDVEPSRAQTDFNVINGNKRVRSTALRAVMGEPMVRASVLACRRWLPQAVFVALQRTEARLQSLNTRSAARVPLNPELRAQLKREFAPVVERLSALLGRDLTHWSR
jgi:hypothetical protein